MKAIYHPRTDVSFAPTPSFVKRYPDEVAAQVEKLTQRTWELKAQAAVPQKEKEEEEVMFIPTQLVEEPENPLLLKEEERLLNEVDIGLLLAGFFSGAVVTYLLLRWMRE